MRALFVLALVAAPIAGCDSGVPQTPGADALLQSETGRYVEGAFPSALPVDGGAPPPMDAGIPDDGGDAGLPLPTIATVEAISTNVRPGFDGKQISALASINARTVAVGLEVTSPDGTLVADRGYWLVAVGLPSLETPGYLDVSVVLDFSSDLPVGPARLLFAAQDASGNFGPAAPLDLTVQSLLPVADLVVALDWTADMDLDLLVQQPDGSILSSRGLITPDGVTVTPDAGVPSIALDSNADCVIDGARLEVATWDSAPSGTYKVFVRTAAACAVPESGWRVRVLRGSTQVAESSGAAFASQVDVPGGGISGTGQLAMTFATGD